MLDLNWKTHVKNVVTERNENFPTINLLRFNIHYNTVYLHFSSIPHRFFETNKIWKTISGSEPSQSFSHITHPVFSSCFHRQSEIPSIILFIFLFVAELYKLQPRLVSAFIPDFIFSFHRCSNPRKFHTSSYQNSHRTS